MPGGLRLASHAHDGGQLVFVLEGSYDERWRQRSLRLRPGAVIFRPPGEPHANTFAEDGALALVVSYRRERLAPLAACRRPLELPSLLADLRAQVELELRRDDPASALALEGLGLLLAARVGRWAAARRPEWLGDAVRFAEDHHAEPIGLAEVAAAVGQHRSTVAAAFRRWLGRSVGESIRAVQVRHAVDALRRTGRPLAEVALDAGFHDQSHMGRWIKRSTGLTPGQVRRRAGTPRR
jgi:AraC family transcriptional regulator